MKTRHCMTIALGVFFLIASCSPMTPGERIEQNPEIFATLPNWEKDKIIAGEITTGMSPNAVLLAWGPPQTIASGQLNGTYAQRWIYSIQEPVNNMPPMGAGFYNSRYNRYGGIYSANYYPVDYIPIDIAYVLFINNKVSSWEKNR